MNSAAGSALGKIFSSAGSSKKPRWLHPEESTGELFRGINLGRKFCWEAIGPARETFTTLAAEIKAYLDSQSEPISSPVTWTMYMIGPTPESSRPTVMFCGADKSSRNLIKETIDNSGLLDRYPGIETGGCSQEFRLLAMEDAMDHITPTICPVEKGILYSHQSAGPGMQIFIKGYNGGSPNIRKARCGGLLYHQDKCFLQTVAHAFEKINNPQIPKESHTEDSELHFELEDHEESDVDEPDVSITGRGSATPDYHPYADHSSDDINMEDSSDEENSPILTNAPSGLHLEEYNQVGSKTKKCTVDPNSPDPSPTSLSMLGKAVISASTGHTRDLDYCLIEIEKSQVSAVEKAFRNTSIALIVGGDEIPLAANGPQDASVSAFAGRSKPLEGKLSGTPTFIMLPGSGVVQELWTIRDLSSIKDGDCGSWVVDSTTGNLYGHIVASSVKSDLTYIIPAKSVFDDIQSRFNGKWYMTKPGPKYGSMFHRLLSPKNSKLGTKPTTTI
jgi:peptide-N4-(N-acetyl-beta-glucosaminyl)asparagine amidase